MRMLNVSFLASLVFHLLHHPCSMCEQIFLFRGFNILDVSHHYPHTLIGSFVLHLLVGFWWDQVPNRWDGSQLLPSQSPTNHPSRFFDSFIFLYQKGNLVNTSKRPLQSSSHKILQFFLDVCRLISHSICEWWDFGGMIDWMWESESWPKQLMINHFIWYRQGELE